MAPLDLTHLLAQSLAIKAMSLSFYIHKAFVASYPVTSGFILLVNSRATSPTTNLRSFLFNAWVCLAACTIYTVIAFVSARRRDAWLRLLDASEAFAMRFGFSKRVASFGRGFSESREFAISMIAIACIFLLLAIANIAAYFHFRHRFA